MRSSSASVHGVPATSSSAKCPPAANPAESAYLAKKSIFVVPLKCRAIWSFDGVGRRPNHRPVKPPVLFSILEYVSYSVADNKTVIGVNRRVPCVENAVDVLAKQNSVGLGVCASFGI